MTIPEFAGPAIPVTPVGEDSPIIGYVRKVDHRGMRASGPVWRWQRFDPDRKSLGTTKRTKHEAISDVRFAARFWRNWKKDTTS